MTLSISSRNPIRMPVSPLQILILIQIDERPKYGYEILKNLRDAFEGVWEPKTGTVYPALKSLEKKGYITVETRGDADYYKITHKGEQLFDDMLNHMDKSIDFSIKYISVVFRWLTKERKESAINFLEAMTHKERLLSDAMLNFFDNLDEASKTRFLLKIKEVSQERLNKINEMLRK